MSNLKAIKRETASSGSINKLRESGFIPAILYGGKDPNQKISIEKKAVRDIINSDSFLSKVLEIEIDGKKEKYFHEKLPTMLCLKNQFILIL